MPINVSIDSGRIVVHSNGDQVVDLPFDTIYTDIPQHSFVDSTQPIALEPFVVPSSFSLDELLTRTLHLLSVGSKSFFVNKFDRSITGLIASQPVSFSISLSSRRADRSFSPSPTSL